MNPKLCKAGQQLRLQIDDAFGNRQRSSDGWLGDTRHSARTSDHNPDANGIVRAIDISRNLSGAKEPDLMPDLADQIRHAAKSDPRIAYIIFDGKIASGKSLWRFIAYKGINPHRHHCHVSFTKKGDANGSFFNIPMIGGTV